MIRRCNLAGKGPVVWENAGNGPVSLSAVFRWALQSAKIDRLLATESCFGGRGRRFELGVAENARDILGKRLLKVFEARGWPGTEKIGHTGRVYIAQFDEELAQAMIAVEDDLFEWLNPSPKKLVEDICLFRRGAEYPAFFSVTHERDAYILSSEAIHVRGFEESEYVADMMLPWKTEYFCLL